jgi:hypothetical protein
LPKCRGISGFLFAEFAKIVLFTPTRRPKTTGQGCKTIPEIWHEFCIYYPVNPERRYSMGSGSCGNVIAALASFFIPLILMGWAIHLWSIIDAAIYEKPQRWHREYYGRAAY